MFDDGLDPFVKWGPIAHALGRISRRTIYDLVKAGRFPPPDRPASRRGEADLWRESTVRRGLEAYANQPPAPGGVAPTTAPSRRAKPSTARSRPAVRKPARRPPRSRKAEETPAAPIA